MPDEAARQVEIRLDTCDLTRVGDDRVLPPALVCFRCIHMTHGATGTRIEIGRVMRLYLAVHNLEGDEVQVDGMLCPW